MKSFPVQAGGSMLEVNLKGKKAFIAGVGDDQGYGWAIAKELAKAGALIYIGCWPPILKIFQLSLKGGKFDTLLPDGAHMEIAGVFPLDVVFDSQEDVPEEIRENKRYKGLSGFTLSEVAKSVQEEVGEIDILVHAVANGPEVQKPLLETSRNGYLAAISASSYSFVSLLHHFGPLMSQTGSAVSLTYLASERAVPGYGGGMSSAKAALESDTRTLAYEAGRKWGIRVNTISAGALPSRAAKAIGFIDEMVNYARKTAPLTKELKASEVGSSAAFLLSELASAVTGVTLYVDNGMHAMGVGGEMLPDA